MLDRDEGALTLQRRKFGKLDFDVSLLGFGCMRLPTVASQTPTAVGKIDYAKAVEMVRYAVDHGVDYIDTAIRTMMKRARSSSASLTGRVSRAE